MNSGTDESGKAMKASRPKLYWLRLLGFFAFLLVATLAYPIIDVVDGMFLKTDGTPAESKSSATVLSDLESRLRQHVYMLAETIGKELPQPRKSS